MSLCRHRPRLQTRGKLEAFREFPREKRRFTCIARNQTLNPVRGSVPCSETPIVVLRRTLSTSCEARSFFHFRDSFESRAFRIPPPLLNEVTTISAHRFAVANLAVSRQRESRASLGLDVCLGNSLFGARSLRIGLFGDRHRRNVRDACCRRMPSTT